MLKETKQVYSSGVFRKDVVWGKFQQTSEYKADSIYFIHREEDNSDEDVAINIWVVYELI